MWREKTEVTSPVAEESFSGWGQLWPPLFPGLARAATAAGVLWLPLPTAALYFIFLLPSFVWGHFLRLPESIKE